MEGRREWDNKERDAEDCCEEEWVVKDEAEERDFFWAEVNIKIYDKEVFEVMEWKKRNSSRKIRLEYEGSNNSDTLRKWNPPPQLRLRWTL